MKRIHLISGIIVAIGIGLYFKHKYDENQKELMNFEVASMAAGIKWIQAEGRIVPRTPDNFEEFIKGVDLSTIQGVHFNSKGGNLWGAMQLGTLIRKYKLNTYVGRSSFDHKYSEHNSEVGKCLSACVIAFLGGVNRFHNNGELGFKKVYTKNSIRKIKDPKFRELEEDRKKEILSANLISYISEMGADSKVLSVALVATSKKPLIFNETGLLELKIITEPTYSGNLEDQ